MTEQELLKLRDLAEHTVVQMKERLTRECKQDVAEEMVCMANGKGGMIVIGINDKTGVVNPLSFRELQETNKDLSDLAKDCVVPGISVVTEHVPVEGGAVVVATVQRGANIPYRDNKGIVWVKNGGDKKRVTDNDELAIMMAEGGCFRPDMLAVKGSSVKDLDDDRLKAYLLSRFSSACKQSGIDGEVVREWSADELCLKILGNMKCEQLLKNVGLMTDEGEMTVAGLMLMGRFPQKWLPSFTVRCVSFVGNSQAGTQFRDKSDASADGCIPHLYRYVMSFLQRNLKSVQKGDEFNSLGELEIPEGALTEVVANALIHRSYVKKAPVRVFVFDNRVEIHSPGLLPDGMDVEVLKKGTSRPVNELLFNHAIHLLPYTGVGTGILRALDLEQDMVMVNDEKAQEFVVTFWRDAEDGASEVDSDVVAGEASSNQVSKQVSKQVSNQVGNQVNIAKKLTKKDLTGQQKDIINFCSVPRSSQEIMDHIGVSNQYVNRRRHLLPLIEAGFIEMTDVESPNSPTQKYRKVRK